MQGFIVFDYASEYAAARTQIGQWLGEGKLKRKETILKGGVSASEEALDYLFQGRNIGKWQEKRGTGNEIRMKLTIEQVNCWSRSRTPRTRHGYKFAL
jgi:hypothetical protein